MIAMRAVKWIHGLLTLARVPSVVCLSLASMIIGAQITNAVEGMRRTLEYAPAAVDNPLKGLVPYSSAHDDAFPHSMEFCYIPLATLMTGYEQFNWPKLEQILDQAAQRGNQTVFRVVLEYPGKKNLLPAFLIDGGLKVHKCVFVLTYL